MSTPESISTALFEVAIHQLLLNDAKPIDELIIRRKALTLTGKDQALSYELFRIRTEGGGLELLRPRLRAASREDLITRLDEIEAIDSGFSPGWWKCQWDDLFHPLQAERLREIANDLHKRLISVAAARELIQEALSEFTSPTNGTAPHKKALSILTDSDAQHVSETEWVIDGIVPAGGLTVVYGEPGSGKSFVLLDWAISVALGVQWMDRHTSQGTTIYFVGEGQEGFKKRIIAAELGRYQSVPAFYWCREQLDLTSEIDLQMILAEVERLRPTLVVFDTLSHYRGGAEENSATEMSPVIKAVDRIRQICGSAIIFAHHPTKLDREVIRGSGSLLGAADCTIHVQGDGKIVKLTCKKMKDAEIAKQIVVTLTKQSWAQSDTGATLDSLQVTQCVGADAMNVTGDNRLQRLEDYMRANAGVPLTAKALQSGAQIRREDVTGLADTLVGRGLVRPSKGPRGTLWTFDVACTENLR